MEGVGGPEGDLQPISRPSRPRPPGTSRLLLTLLKLLLGRIDTKWRPSTVRRWKRDFSKQRRDGKGGEAPRPLLYVNPQCSGKLKNYGRL